MMVYFLCGHLACRNDLYYGDFDTFEVSRLPTQPPHCFLFLPASCAIFKSAQGGIIMNADAERTQVLELVKTLPDDQIEYVLHVIQSLPEREPISEAKRKARDECDKCDMEIINANA